MYCRCWDRKAFIFFFHVPRNRREWYRCVEIWSKGGSLFPSILVGENIFPVHTWKIWELNFQLVIQFIVHLKSI